MGDAGQGREKEMTLELTTEYERFRCCTCNCLEGEIHTLGCDEEKCPFCGGQLVDCFCAYHRLNIPCGLGTDAYKHGLTDAQEAQWRALLEKKGRVPFIEYPDVCARCGEEYPDLFTVPDDEWKHYIEIEKRGVTLCWVCYDEIRVLIDGKGKILRKPLKVGYDDEHQPIEVDAADLEKIAIAARAKNTTIHRSKTMNGDKRGGEGGEKEYPHYLLLSWASKPIATGGPTREMDQNATPAAIAPSEPRVDPQTAFQEVRVSGILDWSIFKPAIARSWLARQSRRATPQ